MFCKYKNKLVRANQQDIIVFLSEQGSKNSLLNLFTQEGFPHLSLLITACKEIQLQDLALDEHHSNTVLSLTVSPEIFNVTACVDLLSLCCEGKSDIA